MSDLRRDAKIVVGSVAATCIAFAIGLAWIAFKPSLPSVLATPSVELAKEKTERLDCKPVLVYRDKVEKDLGLPAIVTKDPDKHVVASSPVPASDYPQTMTAVYDEKVGNVDMFLRQDPSGLLSFYRKSEVGISYGYSDSGNTTRLSGKHEFMHVKSARFAIHGNVDSDSAYFVGAGVFVRW